ncbi:hypothetical protein [Pseudomonas chlororaphis]|uniref:hypothetical protein n=1 Tax=Pseudomonas chlororaphis TaxID=587753 RepID=UPI0023655362|nr:hypothetical protein [Pseudomonas chlororaphis]WDH25120.1 hypothetical protein PUP50_12880 [Pseudomonas chlororaphis]
MAAMKTYVFRLKGKNGNGMNNVLQSGTDQRDAERKVLQRHPGATIVEVREQ